MHFTDIFNKNFPTSLNVAEYFDNIKDLNFASDCDIYSFEDGCSGVHIGNGFGCNCGLALSKQMQSTLALSSTSSLKIIRMGPSKIAENVFVYVGNFTGKIIILVGSYGNVFIGNCGSVNLDIRIGHGSNVVIGDKTTCNGARLVAIKSTIAIKKDSMLSDEILIQGFDQHGIVDLSNKKIINLDKNQVLIDAHCWIGRRATLMPGVSIGAVSIIGACSVVTNDVPKCCLVAGVPAKVLRKGVSWCRPWTHIDEESNSFFNSLKI